MLCGLCPIDTAWKLKRIIYEQLLVTIPLTGWELLPCSGRSPANVNSDAYGQISCSEFIWAVYWCQRRKLFRALQPWSMFTWAANTSDQVLSLKLCLRESTSAVKHCQGDSSIRFQRVGVLPSSFSSVPIPLMTCEENNCVEIIKKDY